MSYPVEGWFIRTTALKERLIELNKTINWQPPAIGEGRFGEWLENNVDWALSRRRYWGTPLPIWQSDKDGSEHYECIGSIVELREKCGDQIPADNDQLDLHRPFVDTLTWPAPDGGTMRRVPDLIDVWFDSGSMPFAQWHYPFENKKEFEKNFPGDFIAEGVDQTRGWFYTLHAIATLVMDSVSYKNVLVNGHLLDDTGEKMSKSKGNIVDPFKTIETYGVDPVRWYLISTSAPWLPIRFDFEALKEVIRKYFDTLRNTYSFFAIYANIDRVAERAAEANQTVETFLESKAGGPETFDRWIVSKFHTLAKEVAEAMDAYELTRPVRAIQYFVIEELSNWYVRNNRRRFWAEGDDPSKMRAFLTLYRVLEGVCRLAAPISPIVSEKIWHSLMAGTVGKGATPLSVHMLPYPVVDQCLIDRELEETMDQVEKLVQLGRAARTRHNLKVRQPLARMMFQVPGEGAVERLQAYLQIVRDELNIKDVTFADDLDTAVTYAAKLNFKVAGPKLGKQVKTVAATIAGLASDEVKRFAQTKELRLDGDSGDIVLTPEEVEIIRTEKEGLAVETDGPVMVALETALSDDLIDEGFAREMVNKIQNMRKSSGLNVTDRIAVQVCATDRLKSAVRKHEDFIRRETLAENVEFVETEESTGSTRWDINGEATGIAVTKV